MAKQVIDKDAFGLGHREDLGGAEFFVQGPQAGGQAFQQVEGIVVDGDLPAGECGEAATVARGWMTQQWQGGGTAEEWDELEEQVAAFDIRLLGGEGTQ